VGTKGIVYKILALQIPSIFNKYLEKCETKQWRSGKHLHQVAPRALHPPMLQTPNIKTSSLTQIQIELDLGL